MAVRLILLVERRLAMTASEVENLPPFRDGHQPEDMSRVRFLAEPRELSAMYVSWLEMHPSFRAVWLAVLCDWWMSTARRLMGTGAVYF
jgi:hypothetical protein